MENNNEVRLNKIPLKLFIDTLVDIYNSGADFIDLVGKPNEIQDTIGIIVRQDYLSSDTEEETIDEEKQLNIKLSDDDLNQLI